MNKKIILLCAILVVLMPFLGLPLSWKTLLLILIGIVTGVSAYATEIRSFYAPESKPSIDTETYSEHIPEKAV